MELSIKLNKEDISMLIDSLNEEIGTSIIVGNMSFDGLNVEVKYNYIDIRPKVIHVDYNGMDVEILNLTDLMYELREELFNRALVIKQVSDADMQRLVDNLRKTEFINFYQFSSHIENFSVTFCIDKEDSQKLVYDYFIYSHGTAIDELVSGDAKLYEMLVKKATSML